MIARQGGARDVNLRAIAKEVGCAHTNAYNYFSGLDDLMWCAMQQVFEILEERVAEGLDDSLRPYEYLELLFANYVRFAEEEPGLFRFISTDPMSSDDVPDEVLEPIERLLNFVSEVFSSLSEGRLDSDSADRTRAVVLAYLDGELSNMINGRTLPGDDIRHRVIENSIRLYEVLTSSEHNGVRLVDSSRDKLPVYPIPFGHRLEGDPLE